MRNLSNFGFDWWFTKADGDFSFKPIDEENWQHVTLPHTWNVEDGQASADYFRSRCWYRKTFPAPKLAEGGRAVLKFEGVMHIGEVFCNGKLISTHKGGYSTFFVELTEHLLPGENILAVRVDNVAEHIYPQMADFTFFGGIYRPVTLLLLEKEHFSIEQSGSDGVFITPSVDGKVHIKSHVSGGNNVSVTILDKMGKVVANGSSSPVDGCADLELTVNNPQRWQGVNAPYLYTALVRLDESDALSIPFGFREYHVDPEKGFFLNGISTPLRGASRHQCREDMGSAITEKEHAEDISLLLEMGANTVLLAHYQHAQPFYNLCDETGLVVWAEIPFISVFDPSDESRENTISQMKELVLQNYNHVSICFWGIGNELGLGGETPALNENLRELNELCRALDPNRLTTIANVGFTKPKSEMCHLTDVFGYNQYLGWYAGKVEDLAPWLDAQHTQLPGRAMGISEYGAECVMGWHSDTPRVRDYTEEYQAIVHEGSMKAISERPYLWGTYIWNMFDFAAANRDEGGSKGRNNKGMVTFDRKIKKDAFYLYKAYLSSQPFVHITGRRYVQRPQESITVKIYSNLPQVALSVNGGPRVAKEGDKIFIFENVPLNLGLNTLVASADGGILDVVELERVTEPNPAYVLPEKPASVNEGVAQWFADMIPQNDELQFPDGYCSVNDEIGYLMGIPEAKSALEDLLFTPLAMSSLDSPATKDFTSYLGMMKELQVSMIYQFVSQMLPKNALVLLNERLNTVKKPVK